MVMWILDKFHYIADVPSKTGGLAIHAAAAYGTLDVVHKYILNVLHNFLEQDNHLHCSFSHNKLECSCTLVYYIVYWADHRLNGTC